MGKAHEGMSGDAIEIEDGGVVHVKSGGRVYLASGAVLDMGTGAAFKANGLASASLTAGLTALTHTAPGTPDYALQNLVQNTGFGFATADEGNTVLKVLVNAVARLAEVEARLEALGIVVAN